MYGTLMRAKVTRENRSSVLALMGEGAGAKGFHATYVLLPDDDDGAANKPSRPAAAADDEAHRASYRRSTRPGRHR